MKTKHFKVIAVENAEAKKYYAKDPSNLWDITEFFCTDYTPIYVVDLDTNKVIKSGDTSHDSLPFAYDCFIEGLRYAGYKVEESYGVIWTLLDNTYLNHNQVIEALEAGIVEEAE
jgi:hypothetical protein